MRNFLRILILFFICLLLVPTSAFAQIDCNNSPYVLERVTAAFNTQGYWALNDIMGQIMNSGMSIIAPFIYICVIIGGLIAVAMGMPPKNYMWWVFGPVLFDFLVFTTVSGNDDYRGVCWKVGTKTPTNMATKMQDVWKIIPTGIVNQNQAHQPIGFSVVDGPRAPAQFLPLYFVEFDKLISDQIGFIVDWAGVGNMKKNDRGNTYMHDEPRGGLGQDDADVSLIMTNQKWTMLEDVSAAVVNNQDTREALVRFFASECGDELARFINKGAYAQARSARGAKVPDTIFNENGDEVDYDRIRETLENYWVPYPPEIRRMLKINRNSRAFMDYNQMFGDGGTNPASYGGYNDFSFLYNFLKNYENGIHLNDAQGFPWFNNTVLEAARNSDTAQSINCMQYLYIIIQAFRWESGFLLNQVISRDPLRADRVAYTFMLGWHVQDENGRDQQLTIDQQIRFIEALGLLHLFKNELEKMTSPVDRTFSASEKSIDYIKANIGQIGSKNKYSELYVWSKMMPYVQGVALYFLPSFYPFACMLMIIPGWHKAIITWAGMYAWVKSWDAGFAIVKSFERNIWAMIGASSDMAGLNGRIYVAQRDTLNEVVLDGPHECQDMESLLKCKNPIVFDRGDQSFNDAIKTLDYGMTFAPFLDLDVSNAYYIYLMSALYFAVPAVTGQILLGAKAGMAGMLASMAGGMASEVSQGAGKGAISEKVVDALNNQAVAAQEENFKAWRAGGKDGFAAKVLGAQASKFRSSLNATRAGLHGSIENSAGGIRSTAFKRGQSIYQTAKKGVENLSDSNSGMTNRVANVPQQLLDIQYQGEMARIALGTQRAKGLMGVKSTQAGANKAYNEEMASQYLQAGQYAAQEKQWLLNRDAGRQLAGRMGAIGMEGSSFAAGQLPTGLGAAGFGMLNSYDGKNNTLFDAKAAFYRQGEYGENALNGINAVANEAILGGSMDNGINKAYAEASPLFNGFDNIYDLGNILWPMGNGVSTGNVFPLDKYDSLIWK